MLQIKKLQEVNKHLKADNTMLVGENKTLVDQCSKLKTLMIHYEKESLYHRLESNVSRNSKPDYFDILPEAALTCFIHFSSSLRSSPKKMIV